MTIGELMAVLGIDTTQLDGAEEKLKEFAKKAKDEFDKTDKAADGAEEGIEDLASSVKTLGPIFAVAGGMAAIMVDWFKQTETAADAANVASSLFGETLNSIMFQRDADYGGALELAKEENRLRAQARIDMVNQAGLAMKIRGYRMEVYDVEASIEDKIKSQKAALQTQKLLEAEITKGKYEELAVVEEKLRRNPIHTKSLQEQARLEKEILDVQNSGSMLMQRSLQSLEKQQKRMQETRKKELEDVYDTGIMQNYEYALQDINTWTQIFGETSDTTEDKLNLYTNTLKELISSGLTPADAAVQQMVRSIKQLNDQLNAENLKAWTDATMLVEQYRPGNEPIGRDLSSEKYGSLLDKEGKSIYFSDPRDRSDPGWRMEEAAKTADESMRLTMGVVNQLDSTFQTMFTNLGGGFEGMITALLDSLRLLIVELTAKAAIFGILTLLSGGTSKLALGAGKLIKGGFLNFFLGGNKFAGGTDYAPGGMSLVGEHGPELVNLPRGSQVIPNHLAGAALGGGQVVFEIEGTRLVGVLQNQNRKSNSFR